MASYKPRDPNSFSSAAAQARDILGVQVAAGIIGKSKSLINSHADEDDPSVPNMRQARQLDDECYLKAGVRPFLTVFQRQSDTHTPSEQPLSERVLCGVSELGDLARAIESALCPNGDGGVHVTGQERSRITREAEDVIAVCEGIIRAVNPKLEAVDGS